MDSATVAHGSYKELGVMTWPNGAEPAGQAGSDSDGSTPAGTTPPLLKLGRLDEASSNSSGGGAYGGMQAYEAAKLRSREAQRRVRQRQKVSGLC